MADERKAPAREDLIAALYEMTISNHKIPDACAKAADVLIEVISHRLWRAHEIIAHIHPATLLATNVKLSNGSQKGRKPSAARPDEGRGYGCEVSRLWQANPPSSGSR